MVSTIQVYIIAIIASLLFILIAAIVSNSIKFEGGSKPKDPAKRKMWFWIIGVIASFSNLIFGLFSYYYPSGNSYARSKLITAIGISTAITFLVYVLIGFILSKVFKNGKLGNWF